MNIAPKFASALRLVAGGDFASFRSRAGSNLRAFRLRRAKNPFVHQRPGFPVVCHPDWPDSADQYREGSPDTWEFDLLAAWLEEGDTFIDAGTNLGLYGFAAAARVGDHGRVLAIDASPAIVAKLRQGASLLPTRNWTTVHAAITDRAGTVDFFVSASGVNTMEQSLRPKSDDASSLVRVSVPAMSLRELAAQHGLTEIAAIKLDIEGAEAAALRGAPPAWFTADGPLWIVEINPEALQRFGAQPRDIADCFPSTAFERWILGKHPRSAGAACRLAPLDESERYDDSVYYNFFALPRGLSRMARRHRLRRFFPAS